MDSGKSLINNDKSLCLYCDKAFSNLIDQENHVERDHTNLKISKGKGSRKSERITKISGVDSFQGCFYCSNRKLTSRCDDLEALFKHLLTAHKDECYVCKCRVRLQSKAALVSHKKNCKIGCITQVDEKKLLQERADKKQGTKKKQVQCDNLSDPKELLSHQIRTNAMIKKSEKRHTSYSILNKRNYVTKNSSSSSTISSCSSSKASEEYAIPLTRQKLKDPSVNSSTPKNRATSSNKKSLKASVASILCPLNEEKQDEFPSSTTLSSGASKLPRTKHLKGINILQNNNIGNSESVENSPSSIINLTKNEVLSSDFDDDFYNKISHNIKLNLNNFIDGKADSLWNNKFKIENLSDSNHLDHQDHENEIHQATNFELSAPPFPALLTAEQYGYGDSNPNKNKRKFTKNSWKWRWDLIKKYKYVNEGGKVVKKVKQITTGLKDLSQLDMWTQLSMRSRYENLNGQNESNHSFNNKCNVKSHNIEELNEILDKRLTPEIHIEQLQQMVVKEELVENEKKYEDVEPETSSCKEQMLKTLQLAKICCDKLHNSASLSGEWARPRCFICIDCGVEFDLMKSLNDHKNSEHPYVVSAHYEVVGRENLEHKLYKNLFIPKKALNTIGCSKSISMHSDSKSNEISTSSQESDAILNQKEKECTKCQKIIKYSNDIDIYRHILDCIEDKVWMQAKRRNKYRRSRRKPKKYLRKNQNRTLIEQKKAPSCPLNKDNTEETNSSISISNPLASKEDESKLQKGAVTTNLPAPKLTKNLSGVSENFISSDERGNIKSFFRVSKTTPNLPQKMVVQMLQMPNTHTHSHNNNSVRHSLRSSVKKIGESNNKNIPENLMNFKSNESNDYEKISKNEGTITKCEKLNNKAVILAENIFFNQVAPSITLTSLQINTPEKNKSILCPINSPTNSTASSLVSPTSCSSVPKKKKKLNDCIAMLTCKIQEKLGVNFFANPSSDICHLETIVPQLQENTIEIASNTSIPLLSTLKPSFVSSEGTALKLREKCLMKQDASTCPEQSRVIDLSLKKYSSTEKEKSLKNNVCFEKIENITENYSNGLAEGKTDISSTSTNKPSENESELLLKSFIISIEKEKIPDLDFILEKQNSITVSKLKISESERKAFEEQKNRIMQILGKKTPVSECKKIQTLTKKSTIQIRKKLQKYNGTKKNSSFSVNFTPSTKEKTLETHEGEGSSIECQHQEILNADISQHSTRKDDLEQGLKISKEKNESYSEILVELIPRKNTTQKREKLDVKEDFIEKDFLLTENNNDMKSKTLNHHLAKVVEAENFVKEISQNNLKKGDSGSIPFIAQNDTFIEEKIQQAIKATNRIRCRRLSVVVDPIVHIPGFQNNRKIRLTNNSQQNGFYDLLTNDQIFTAIKNTPQLKKEIQKFATKKGSTSETLKEDKTNIKKIAKAKRRSLKYATGKVMKVTKKRKKITAKNCAEKSETNYTNGKNVDKCNNVQETFKNALNKKNVNTEENNPLKTTKSTTKKSFLRANSEKTKLSLDEPKPKISKFSKIEKSKFSRSRNFINVTTSNVYLGMEDKIKPSVRQKEDPNIQTEEREKMLNVLTEKHAKKSLLKSNKRECLIANDTRKYDEKQDASLSSDSSVENDIPLAKLMSSPALLANQKTKESKIKQAETKNLKSNFENAIEENLKRKINTSKSNVHIKTNHNLISTNNLELKLHTRKDNLIPESTTTTKQSEAMSNIQHSKRALGKNILSSSEEIKPKDFPCKVINSDVFSLNEDSFFNDDNDVDQANDKINALVKNIINSSELIDSENEKIYNLKQKSTCFVCNKTFKDEKVLEKHYKTSTHLMKEKRREKHKADNNETLQKLNLAQSTLNEETKVFRTKGALKTFDNIISTSSVTLNSDHKQSLVEFRPIVEDSNNFILSKENENLEDDDEELSTKDKIFDSLFSNIENKLQAAAKNELLPKFDFPALSHHDSESSTASWDLKNDADIDWDASKTVEKNCETPTTMLSNHSGKSLVASSGGFAKEKIYKIKEAIVPTKSLIMGKIFKKHRDKQKTPQADAPFSKPEIKNSLDEIFDHLKNSAEIDNKVSICPSPKSLLKTSGRTFSPNSSHSSDMLETASHSNNLKIHKPLIQSPKTFNKNELEKNKISKINEQEEENGIGKRKSRRRCTIKMKTFAETWSSDEYEELHDTNDIISIINEIEKRESTLKKKEISSSEITYINDFCSKEKNVTLYSNCLIDSKLEGFKKRRKSTFKDGCHKSDDDLQKCPLSFNLSSKKRRMSCFLPSTSKLNLEKNAKKTASNFKMSANTTSKDYENKPKCETNLLQQKKSAQKIIDNSLVKHGVNNFSNLSALTSQTVKKKNQKHRKRPRNKIKNIAYDSDSDFELNLRKKTKAVASNTAHSETENESNIEDANDISSDSTTLMTVTKKQPKLLPNDLKVVALQTISIPKTAIAHDQLKPFQQKNKEALSVVNKSLQENTCNRTKRHSSEKLYYWSSSDSDDIEQGDMPEGGENEDSSMIPQQPEQHGWIVGDSHKKLVTLLAHAKIKNKIN